jgi:DNA mismatch repair protein MutS
MRFTTDEQTLDDLSIFGKRGRVSVYGIFNRTATRGGAQLLEDMFRYPLAGEGAINHRVGIIRYLAGVRAGFPFPTELFDIAEQYLANADERTRLTGEERTLGGKLAGMIGSDEVYKNIAKGVGALVRILHTLKEVSGGAAEGRGAEESAVEESAAYRTEMATIAGLLSDPAFGPLLQVSAHNRLTYVQVAAFDVLLRFRHRETIRQLLRHIYTLDVYITAAKVARERGFSFARALPAGTQGTKLDGVYHPLLKDAVPNTLEITPDGNVLFLTGANMAGKSTFMKSLGIALFLAHVGLPVPAAAMEFTVLDGLYATINLPDNLGLGASHFYAEVLRVKKVAQELGRSRNIFVLFDELFRGTNVKDAYEATIAITTAFAQKKNSLFVISTHIIEAGPVLERRAANIRFLYLPTLMEGNVPVYTYTIRPGITADRHGMIIINNEGILDTLRGGKITTP